MVNITELRIDNGQAFEIMPGIQLFRHAHAAMQLHCLLADETTRFTDLDFRTGGAFLRSASPSTSFILTI